MKRGSARQLAAHSSLARLLLLAPLAPLSLLGCASIIGLDEYTVRGSGGGAGKGGGSSSGGASGKGGESGSDFVPPVVGCDGESELQANPQIVRSCILRAGCDPTFAPVRTISTCVTYNTQAALAGESCNLTSTSCADFEACEHIGIAHDDLCGPQTDGTRCQGELALNCGNYEGDDRFYDCVALGGSCGTFSHDGVLFADCQLDIAPDSCAGVPNSDSQYFCHTGQENTDDLRYYCWEGQAYGASCSPVASCIDAPDESSDGNSQLGNANCFFDTHSCSCGDSVSCNADVATVCSGGSQFEYNCGSVGLSCSITGQKEHCLAPGCNAADVDFVCQERCSDDGSSLTFCYGGAPYTVDCKDYGFTRCATGSDPNSGQTFAACRF